MKKAFSASFKNCRAVLLAYAAVIFSGNPWVGGLLCIASLLAPWIGLAGLAGTFITLAAARSAGFDRSAIDDGRLLFNSLLCSLTLGAWAPPGSLPALVFAALLVLVPLTALGCTLILNQMTLVLVGTASRSLPYCLVAAGLNWLLTRIISVAALPNAGPWFLDWHIPLPPVVEWWARSLGTIFFAPTALAGLIATLALAVASRLSLLNALVGYGISALLLSALGFPLAQSYWLQLDAIFCAVALGGVFFVPSRASLGLAAFGAALCIIIGVALTQGLRWIDTPILTLPFNVVVLGVAGALRWRVAGREPRAALYPGKNPEATLRADRLWQARNPEPALPAIAPPFDGVWVVTQGFNGQPTHSGAWQYALDFEMADAALRPDRPPSGDLRDFSSFDAPIVSPADGHVVRLVDDIADNPIGGINLSENWGNSLVLEIAPGLFAQLSHFRRRGFKVREGDRVRQGQLLGYLGNSGRSPLPHLHLQMQTRPEIGSPTIPFRLHSYRAPVKNNRWEYCFRGVPALDEALAGCRNSRWMEEAIEAVIGREQAYRVFSARGEERETIRGESPAHGSLVLRSIERGAQVRLIVGEGRMTPVDFTGSEHSLLAAFRGTCRMPLTALSSLQWTDFADFTGKVNWGRRMFDDLAGPFTRQQQATVRAEMISCDVRQKHFAVRCESPDLFTTELRFASNLGLVSGRHETKSDWLHFHAVGAETETTEPAGASAARPQSEPEYSLK